MSKIDGVYYGKRDAMIAEVGTPDYYEGRYLVQIVGEGDWDAEGFNNKKEATAHAKYVAAQFSTKTVRVF